MKKNKFKYNRNQTELTKFTEDDLIMVGDKEEEDEQEE